MKKVLFLHVIFNNLVVIKKVTILSYLSFSDLTIFYFKNLPKIFELLFKSYLCSFYYQKDLQILFKIV